MWKVLTLSSILMLLLAASSNATQMVVLADPEAGIELDRLAGEVRPPNSYYKLTEQEASIIVSLVKVSVANARDANGELLLPFNEYGLQLIGIAEDKVRYIKVFGFCRPEHHAKEFDLRFMPLTVMGGGSCFFSGKYRL